jgi:hypothetical protein
MEMKPFALNKLFSIPKYFLWFGVLLSLSFSSFAQAAGEAGRDFNHMTTGYPLLGLHTTVDCGTCHVGGVFKGTPRNCSGCHTKGKRIIATAMSSKHIVTTEACEICHTNTVTFYGAKFNHGKAVTGQCTTCHNGIAATGKPASHTSVSKATKSCDNCHRTYAWSPASWNHYLNRAACVTCHVTGGDGAAFVKTAIAGTSAQAFAHNAQNSAISCESCHSNYTSWAGALYDHSGAGASPTCSTCHDGSRATGKAQKSGHPTTTAECSECHIGNKTWSGALGAAPANHSALNTASGCKVCHVGAATSHVTGATLHTYISGACYTCHGSSRSVAFSSISRTYPWPSFHESSKNPSATDCSASGCHRPLGTKGSAYTRWD